MPRRQHHHQPLAGPDVDERELGQAGARVSAPRRAAPPQLRQGAGLVVDRVARRAHRHVSHRVDRQPLDRVGAVTAVERAPCARRDMRARRARAEERRDQRVQAPHHGRRARGSPSGCEIAFSSASVHGRSRPSAEPRTSRTSATSTADAVCPNERRTKVSTAAISASDKRAERRHQRLALLAVDHDASHDPGPPGDERRAGERRRQALAAAAVGLMARHAQPAVDLLARLEPLLLGGAERRHRLGLPRLARPVHAVEETGDDGLDLAALVRAARAAAAAPRRAPAGAGCGRRSSRSRARARRRVPAPGAPPRDGGHRRSRVQRSATAAGRPPRATAPARGPSASSGTPGRARSCASACSSIPARLLTTPSTTNGSRP